MSKWFFFFAGVAFFVWGTSVVLMSLGPGADVAVEALLFDADRVHEAEGFVHRGDGYSVEVRFQADESWVGALAYHGFSRVPCEGVREHVRFSWTKLAVWPPWRPDQVVDALCFRRLGQNTWSPEARDYLLAAADGSSVYLSGLGRGYERGMPGEEPTPAP